MSSEKAELTRISNFIEKEVSVNSFDEMYQSMFHLDEVMKKAQDGMEKLKKYLIDQGIKPEEFYPELGKKIVFQEGKKKTEIDPRKLTEVLTFDDLMKVVKVNESALKKLEHGEQYVSMYKDEVGKAKDSILVKDMTKKELKEHSTK